MKAALADSAPLMAELMILTLAIIWFLQKMIKSGEKGASPPGPRGLPIVGYMPFLRRDLHRQLTELAAVYGPIYRLRLGSKLCTVVNSSSLAKEVFRDNDVLLSNRDITMAARIATSDFNDIAWSPYGPGWRDRRKVLSREMLSQSNLKASYNLRKDTIRRTIGEIYADEARTPINIGKLGLKIDLDLIINMVWGGKIGVEQRDRISAGLLPVMGKLLDLLAKPNISDFFPVLARFDFQGIAKEMTAQIQQVEAMTKDAIEERIKYPTIAGDQEEGRKDFMQTLVDLMQKESYKSSLGVKQIKAMLVDVLIAGTDTTSTTIEWVMAQLLLRPKVMKKVQQELNEVVGMNNILEETHMPKLVYLYAVIKETMRLNSVGPLIARTLYQSCTVGGYTIPKDSTVFINAWALHREPEAWDDPSEFRPERFLEAGGAGKTDFSGNNFNFLPFGSGRRMCAGVQLAERMLIYMTGSLLHSFEWRLPDGDEVDMSDELATVLRKRIPLSVVPIPRLPHPELYN